MENRQGGTVVDLPVLQSAAEDILKHVLQLPGKENTPLTRLSAISMVLVSDRRMAGLHRRFLLRHGPTDVITFDHGEIVISVETAKRNARRFGSSLDRELRLYFIHGLLHLHGFDDTAPGPARNMAQVQERILRKVAR